MSAGVRPEYIGYRHSDAVPGLEVLDAYDSPREWRTISEGFAVVFTRTWRGRTYYRGQRHEVEPGVAFCNHPGEGLVATPHARVAGSFNVLIFSPVLLNEWLADYQSSALRPHWRAVTQPISVALAAKFRRFLHALEPEAPAMHVQSEAAEFSQRMIGELMRGAQRDPVHAGPHLRGTARMRECLNEDGADIDLATLAERAGLNRFQALRSFKKRYGLPPHAYQLCLRVTRARRMLLEGAPPADVAAHCGFVDQSHFNRHFKRIMGVTPMQYVASFTSSKARSSGVYRSGALIGPDPAALVTRSDWRR